MPTPLSQLRSKSGGHVLFPAPLDTLPHLAVYPMQVIAIWAAIDNLQAEMLAGMLNVDVQVAVAAYQTIRNVEAQHDVLYRAAEQVLSTDDYRLLQAIVEVTKPSRTRRNHYAHYLWGTFGPIGGPPVGLLLVNPRDRMKPRTAMRDYEMAMRKWIEEVRSAPPDAWPEQPVAPESEEYDHSKIMAYREQDLRNDVKDAEQCRQWFLGLRWSLIGPAAVQPSARQGLLGVPRLAQKIQALSTQTAP